MAEAVGRQWPRPLLLASGRFDILRTALVRELSEARERTGAQCLVAAVGPLEDELAPLAARAEMAAAMRVIDYVLLLQDETLAGAGARLQPVEIIRLEASETGRIQDLARQLRQKG